MKIYLDHVGIACENLEDASNFWNLIGLIQGGDEVVQDQGVITRFFSTSENDSRAPKIDENKQNIKCCRNPPPK